MTRLIAPIILVGVAIAGFFFFTKPVYNDIAQLRTQVAYYNEALDNSKALENERDKLTAKYNAINPDDLIKLTKFLPENIDNIRLILEIEQIASPYGMALKDIKYNTITANENATKGVVSSRVTGAVPSGGVTKSLRKDYGVWDLSFSTTGTYNNFLSFTKDLESNLRIVDISSIQFSSTANSAFGSPSAQAYKYDFKIKTYWLKN